MHSQKMILQLQQQFSKCEKLTDIDKWLANTVINFALNQSKWQKQNLYLSELLVKFTKKVSFYSVYPYTYIC